MGIKAAPGESYTIRRKVFKILGAGFHIYDAQGDLVGYCKQRAFKLREDLRIYTDESMGTELMRIGARSVIDFSATYDVTLPDGQTLGSMRRRGVRSIFRDAWLVFDAGGNQVATLQEDSNVLALVRRFVDNASFLLPQKFELTRGDGTTLARFRTHFNPFVYRLGVTVVTDDAHMDELMILALGCLVAAIEGRQG